MEPAASSDAFESAPDRGGRVGRVIAVAVVVVAVLWGLALVGLSATVGHCSAFGGPCPADPPPWSDDDVFGMSAFGGALIAGPVLALRRGERRWSIAIAGALVAALVVGAVVRTYAHG